jgi:hypothetical protein
MGRKGVSKRKPKKSRPFSPADTGGSANTDHSPVQSLVKDRGSPPNRNVINPAAGSTKKHKKGS